MCTAPPRAAPFPEVGDLVETPAYSDHAVESGKRYRYAVSAVDQLGNESARVGRRRNRRALRK